MTVKDVFELRKQGKIEEAYAAIRPMYAVHQGKYTTLAMFWTASDILRKRVDEKKPDEAVPIFKSLLRIAPTIDDQDGKVHAALMHDALLLSEGAPDFRMLDFLEHYGMENLTEGDWQVATSKDGHPLPSTAQRMLTRAFHEIQEQPSEAHALQVMPLLQEALRRSPRHKNNQRCLALIYKVMNQKEKAADIYRQLIAKHHDSYLYAELSELVPEDGMRAALLCRAIQTQRQEMFRMGYRLSLARMLIDRDQARAAYELNKCATVRQSLGYAITQDMKTLMRRVADIVPPSDAEQQSFYQQMVLKFRIP
jgi:tetratricopeptide (TPR) repeat protein